MEWGGGGWVSQCQEIRMRKSNKLQILYHYLWKITKQPYINMIYQKCFENFICYIDLWKFLLIWKALSIIATNIYQLYNLKHWVLSNDKSLILHTKTHLLLTYIFPSSTLTYHTINMNGLIMFIEWSLVMFKLKLIETYDQANYKMN